MPSVEFMGKTFTVDEDGFIDSYENWSQEWVQWVKKEEGIEELNDEHQKVIDVLRDYYEKNGIAPMIKSALAMVVCANACTKLKPAPDSNAPASKPKRANRNWGSRTCTGIILRQQLFLRHPGAAGARFAS